MKLLFLMNLVFLSSVTLAHAQESQEAAASIARPPQYVLLAYDGSLNLDAWNESLTFGKENNIKYTYFISGVYFLMNQFKNLYREPVHGVGQSYIGFGGNDADKIRRRVGFVNQAYDSGNEIGSHVNGHYDGTRYSYQSWLDEFKQFCPLIFNVFKNNKIESATAPFHFDEKNFKGFRAPLLGANAAMYKVLGEFNYTYDTSQIASTDYWPKKERGVWNFALSNLRIAGTAKSTISMDYNFYDAQSGGNEKPAMKAVFKKQMLDTYFNYFNHNYQGNRAPINIGHHFSKWNGGAYWEAMQEFAHAVCGLPEVKCVTYKELEKFMESQTPEALKAYQAGQFPKLAGPGVHAPNLSFVNLPSRMIFTEKSIDLDSKVTFYDQSNVLEATFSGKNREEILKSEGLNLIWKVNGQVIHEGAEIKIALDNLNLHVGDVVQLAVENNGVEILTETRQVEALPTLKGKLVLALSSEVQEKRHMLGDMAEAHEHDSDSQE